MRPPAKDLYDTENRSKVAEYLDLVEARVLRPLSSDAVRKSCSTTLLLVFATIDALGKLSHPNSNAGPGPRFRKFLSFLGEGYQERSKELWKLRNALVHNAINVEAYLSSTELGDWAHLQMIGGNGLIYLNTNLVSRDLMVAYARLKELLKSDEEAAQRASDRLKWVEDTQDSLGDIPLPTQPPQVIFVNTC